MFHLRGISTGFLLLCSQNAVLLKKLEFNDEETNLMTANHVMDRVCSSAIVKD